jgi:hypothetical protein
MRHFRLDGAPLTLAQIGADFENEVARRQPIEPRQLGEHIRRHDSRSGAELEHIAPTQRRQNLGALSGDAPTEQR